MKYLYTIPLFLLFISATIWSDTPRYAYKGGEFLKFRVHYSMFNAAYATLEVKEENLNGRPHYHVIGKGNSAGALRMFYKVDDRYETYIDINTGTPSRFIRKINEGGYTKDKELTFFHNIKKVLVNDKKNKKETYYNTKAGIQDMLSSFYYLRNQKTDHLKNGDFLNIDIFMDEEIYPFKLKIINRETISTKFGKIKCLVIRPYVQKGRIFEGNESVTMWISDDDNHIPMRIKAKLLVGNISADLDEYKNLKYPIHFQK